MKSEVVLNVKFKSIEAIIIMQGSLQNLIINVIMKKTYLKYRKHAGTNQIYDKQVYRYFLFYGGSTIFDEMKLRIRHVII